MGGLRTTWLTGTIIWRRAETFFMAPWLDRPPARGEARHRGSHSGARSVRRIGGIRNSCKNPGKTAVNRTHESVVNITLCAIQAFQRFLIPVTRNRGNPKKPEKIRVFGQSSSSTNSKIWYELAQGPLDESWSKTCEHV
jgi:hypothetical protein